MNITKQFFVEFLEGERKKWVGIFDYHSDMSRERHRVMRNTARAEIEYFTKLINEINNV